MFEVFNSYWSLLGLPITAIVGWFLGGRQVKNQELKKGVVDIKTAEIDYATKVGDLYESLLAEQKKDKETLKGERDQTLKDAKEDREYFRSQIDDIRKQAASIQKQLNDLNLAYAREVEVSSHWKEAHSELREKFLILESKYSTMEAEYENLKKAHDKLKTDFDKYKKESKV